MKNLILAAMMLLTGSASATVVGKLDISPNFDAIVFRELNDGMWLGGAQKTLWHLERTSDGLEVFHIAAFWASRPEAHSNMVYGPAIGANIGSLVRELALKIAVVAETAAAMPPWVGKVGNWITLDAYGGYRPIIGYDEHHWAYGVGGKVNIPVSNVFSFISKEQGGGL